MKDKLWEWKVVCVCVVRICNIYHLHDYMHIEFLHLWRFSNQSSWTWPIACTNGIRFLSFQPLESPTTRSAQHKAPSEDHQFGLAAEPFIAAPKWSDEGQDFRGRANSTPRYTNSTLESFHFQEKSPGDARAGLSYTYPVDSFLFRPLKHLDGGWLDQSATLCKDATTCMDPTFQHDPKVAKK